MQSGNFSRSDFDDDFSDVVLPANLLNQDYNQRIIGQQTLSYYISQKYSKFDKTLENDPDRNKKIDKLKKEAFLADYHFLQTFNPEYDTVTDTVNGTTERVIFKREDAAYRLSSQTAQGFGEFPETIDFDSIYCDKDILDYLLDTRIKTFAFLGLPVPDFATVKKCKIRLTNFDQIPLTKEMDPIKEAILEKFFGEPFHKSLARTLVEATFKGLILIPRIVLRVPVETVTNLVTLVTEYLPRRNASPIGLFIGRAITSPLQALRDYASESRKGNRVRPVAKIALSFALTTGFVAATFPVFKLVAGLKVVGKVAVTIADKLPAKVVALFDKISGIFGKASNTVGQAIGTPALNLVEGAGLTLSAAAAKGLQNGASYVGKKVSKSQCLGRGTYGSVIPQLKDKEDKMQSSASNSANSIPSSSPSGNIETSRPVTGYHFIGKPGIPSDTSTQGQDRSPTSSL